jgi:hypothetical protein
MRLVMPLLMLMLASPSPRQPEDSQENRNRSDLESRFARLSHLRGGVHGIVLGGGGGEEGHFGINSKLLGDHGRLMYDCLLGQLAQVMAGNVLSSCRIEE